MLFLGGVKLKKINAFNRQLRYFMVISGLPSSVAFFLSFYFLFFILNSVLACLLFATNGWIFAAVMLYSSVMHFNVLFVICCTSVMYHTLQTWHASSIIA